jgi:hypothetical protein
MAGTHLGQVSNSLQSATIVALGSLSRLLSRAYAIFGTPGGTRVRDATLESATYRKHEQTEPIKLTNNPGKSREVSVTGLIRNESYRTTGPAPRTRLIE